MPKSNTNRVFTRFAKTGHRKSSHIHSPAVLAAVAALFLSCISCSGIPITEAGKDKVVYPSGCTDGCAMEYPENIGNTDAENSNGIKAAAAGIPYQTFSTARDMQDSPGTQPAQPRYDRALRF